MFIFILFSGLNLFAEYPCGISDMVNKIIEYNYSNEVATNDVELMDNYNNLYFVKINYGWQSRAYLINTK